MEVGCQFHASAALLSGKPEVELTAEPVGPSAAIRIPLFPGNESWLLPATLLIELYWLLIVK